MGQHGLSSTALNSTPLETLSKIPEPRCNLANNVADELVAGLLGDSLSFELLCKKSIAHSSFKHFPTCFSSDSSKTWPTKRVL